MFEGLSRSLKNAAENDTINGCCVCMASPAITRLLFADDNFLFFKSTTEEASLVKQILNEYEA